MNSYKFIMMSGWFMVHGSPKRQRKKDERSMGERRIRSKTAGRICEKHRTIDTKTQIGTKK
jgi:hypothetical protein